MVKVTHSLREQSGFRAVRTHRIAHAAEPCRSLRSNPMNQASRRGDLRRDALDQTPRKSRRFLFLFIAVRGGGVTGWLVPFQLLSSICRQTLTPLFLSFSLSPLSLARVLSRAVPFADWPTRLPRDSWCCHGWRPPSSLPTGRDTTRHDLPAKKKRVGRNLSKKKSFTDS